MHGQQNIKNKFLLQMSNIIRETFLICADFSKHHSVYRSEEITTPSLIRKCRGPCSYVKMTAALYQQTSLVSGKYFLFLIVCLQFVKCLSDTCFMNRLCFNSLQTNQPTRCNNFSISLLEVHVQLNIFRASSRPSLGAQQLQ
jgi:hypothetical protein